MAVCAAAQQISEPLRGFGTSITAAYEGWFDNADGSHNFLIGYLQSQLQPGRRRADRPEQPMEPNGPDLGQPTHFLPGRQTGVFLVTVPKEFGPKERITWSITVNGQTTSIPFWMNPDYQVSPVHRHRGRQQAAGDQVRGDRPDDPGTDHDGREGDRAHGDDGRGADAAGVGVGRREVFERQRTRRSAIPRRR